MSLRVRLALWYGTLTLLATTLVGLLTYVEHTRAHYDEVDRYLVGAAAHVADEAAAATTLDELRQVVGAPLQFDVVVRAYDGTGALLVFSPGAESVPAIDSRATLATPDPEPFDPIAGLAVPIIRVDGGRGHFGLVTGSDGSRWRLYVLPTDGLARDVVVAAPLSQLDTATVRFRSAVAISAGAVAAVALLLGWLLAGRALRPVAQLTATANAIARSRQFDKRLPAAEQRDEMGVMAATFNSMLDSLEQAYRVQQRFVADASHELRAPLTAIQANLDLLERQVGMSAEERREALGEASRETHRLARLVADLLALARADAGVPMTKGQVELDRVLLDALNEARHLVSGQEIEVAALEPVLVEGSEDRLKQLLVILLDNAIKYTPPGGRITLALRRNGLTAEIVVQDRGVGIPPEDLHHVFERFYRADPARGRDPGGTGLGLPIARWITDQHGGTITLESGVGRGTTAVVRLPRLT